MKQKKRSVLWRDVAQNSLILSVLFIIFEKTRFLLTHGFFARAFTAYSEEERLLKNGLFSFYLSKRCRWRENLTILKHKTAFAFESSVIVVWIEKIFSSMLYRRMKTYGAFLLSLGISGTLVYIFREFILEDSISWHGNWIFSVGSVLFSVPFLMSSGSMASAILKSWIPSCLLFRYFGYSRDSFRQKRKEPKHYGVASSLGVLLGILTYFVSPNYYFGIFGVLLFLLLVFRLPEAGVLLLVASIPFLYYTGHATLCLVCGVLLVDLSYGIKWICGRRSFRLRLMDYAVLAVILLFLLNGLVSAGGDESLRTAVLYIVLLSAYFLIVNLLRSREWIQKTWKTLFFSGVVSCFFSIFEIFTGTVNASWVDMKLFSQTVRIAGGFDNPNVYAEYLLILLPLSFLFLMEQKEKGGRIFATFLCAVIVLCLINTWSRGAWLGLLVAFISGLLILDKHSPVYLLGGALVAPSAPFWLPSSVSARLLSIGNLRDSSVSYRLSVWKGIWRMLGETLWCGIGVGYSAFSSIYPSFAYGGSAQVRHAHSFYLQIWIEFGIMGFFVVALVLFLFFQMCFEFFLKIQNRWDKRLSAIGLSSVLGLLVMGLTDSIWYDARIFFGFWVMIALVSAWVRVCFFEQESMSEFHENSPFKATISLGENSMK